MTPTANLARDLRGASRLAIDAVTGVAALVEAMHAGIARLPGRAVPDDGRAGGLAGLVYRSVRGVTRVVGGSLDRLLAELERVLAETPSTAAREAVLAALNGVLGDRLEARGNPLAITMALRVGGVPLALHPEALARALPGPPARVLVLLHGLCMNDRQWARDGADFPAALARDLGVVPIHLHYNTGRHVSANGADFAALMRALLAAWPGPPPRIDLLAHSMGGLVARSALHLARVDGQDWPDAVRRVVFLGTPHHGAPLERGGHQLDQLLALSRYSAPFARLGRIRSAGITDLRHGSLLDSDWSGHDRFAHGHDTRTPVPLPAGITCHAVAAVAADRAASWPGRLIGDGLVPLDSALGRHRRAEFDLGFAPAHQWVAAGTGHLQLQTSPAVYARVRDWLADDLTTA